MKPRECEWCGGSACVCFADNRLLCGPAWFCLSCYRKLATITHAMPIWIERGADQAQEKP